MEDNSLRAQQLKKMELLHEVDRICSLHGIRYFLDFGTAIGAARHKGYIPWDDDIDLGMPISDYKKFLKIAAEEIDPKFFLQTMKTDKGYSLPFCKIRMNGTTDLFIPWKHIKMHHGLSLDIFPFFPLYNNKLARKIQLKLGVLYKISYGGRGLSQSRGGVKKLQKILSVFPKGFVGSILFLFIGHASEKKAKYFSHLTEDPKGFFTKEQIYPLTKIEFEDGMYPIPNDYDAFIRSMYGDYMVLPPEEERVEHGGFIVDLYNSYEKYTEE